MYQVQPNKPYTTKGKIEPAILAANGEGFDIICIKKKKEREIKKGAKGKNRLYLEPILFHK